MRIKSQASQTTDGKSPVPLGLIRGLSALDSYPMRFASEDKGMLTGLFVVFFFFCFSFLFYIY